MRIVISADIEGASGVVVPRERGLASPTAGDRLATIDYQRAMKWLTGDINAAVEGAMEAGANEFVVHDSHGFNMTSILLDELHPAVQVVRGAPIIFYEAEDLKNKYDGSFMIAMHAKGGDAGVASHNLSWPRMTDIRINGRSVGESEFTVAIAGYFNIPTLLITGDDMTCNEIKKWTDGQIETAIVKESFSRYCAKVLPIKTAQERIREAAYKAVKRINEIKPVCFKPPIKLEVEFQDRECARYVSLMPQIGYDGNRTISYISDDFYSIYKAMVGIFWLGRLE